MNPALMFGLVALLTALVFLVDVIAPQGYSGAILYAPLIVASLATGRKATLAAGILYTALVIVGGLYSPHHMPDWGPWVNRGVCLLTIWATVVLTYRLKRTEQYYRDTREEYNRLQEDMSTLANRLRHYEDDVTERFTLPK